MTQLISLVMAFMLTLAVSAAGAPASEHAPGHGGTPPGQGGTPPGQAKKGEPGTAPSATAVIDTKTNTVIATVYDDADATGLGIPDDSIFYIVIIRTDQ